MQARDKQHYIETWEAHIDQLVSLGMPLIDADRKHWPELQAIQARLKELTAIAADQTYTN